MVAIYSFKFYQLKKANFKIKKECKFCVYIVVRSLIHYDVTDSIMHLKCKIFCTQHNDVLFLLQITKENRDNILADISTSVMLSLKDNT